MNINEPDSVLLHAISKSDEKAFSKLYAYYSGRLLTFASSMVHSLQIAEEVVEDVFIRLWNNREHITDIENVAVYLYVAVKNQSLNKLSRKARELIVAPYDGLVPDVAALQASPLDIMVSGEMVSRMNAAIEALPPKCKMIFKLIREDGLRYKEVATILNISVNTIDAQMAIAVKRICEALGIKKPVPKKSALRI